MDAYGTNVSGAPGRIGPGGRTRAITTVPSGGNTSTSGGMFGPSTPATNAGGPGGMFGNSAGYAPSLNPADFASRTYDFSGIKKGAESLMNAPALNLQSYNPYQFTGYGQSSPEEINNVYRQAMSTATKPIQAQAAARMNGVSQGFGGNRFAGGAAQRTQALRNSMQTGSDITNVSGQIGSQLADRSLTQAETARANNFANQGRQAAENFQAAGYNSGIAKTMSDDVLSRANQFTQIGFQLPQLQMSMNQAGMQPYNDMYNQMMKMAGGTVPIGTNLQQGGK